MNYLPVGDEIYYRIKRRKDNTFVVCCLQYFDEYDYDERDWVKNHETGLPLCYSEDSEPAANKMADYLNSLVSSKSLLQSAYDVTILLRCEMILTIRSQALT